MTWIAVALVLPFLIQPACYLILRIRQRREEARRRAQTDSIIKHIKNIERTLNK